MTTSPPPEFSPQELELVQKTLFERYGAIVVVHPVEVELQIDLEVPKPTLCSALYWQQGEAEFVVARVILAPGMPPTYRTQFFYGEGGEVFGTGVADYGNLGDCLITVLKTEATYAETRGENKTTNQGQRAAQPKVTGDDEYDGPLVI